jgi:peptidoglycan hydrolase-like protein with peptidoglycan-binding domain
MQNLTIGSRGSSVEELQKALKAMNLYSGAIDGIYGNNTANAIRQFQQSSGIKVDGIFGPETTSAMKVGYESNNLPNQNSGNISRREDIMNNAGQPVSDEDFKKRVEEEKVKLAPYFDANQRYDVASIENQLAQEQNNYQRYLDSSAASFGQAKDQADTGAANRGVLFSTSRQQDLQNLQNQYQADNEAKRDAYATNIKNQMMSLQQNWGQGAADSTNLRNLAKLGTQDYNAFVPKGQVSSGSLSSVYNAGDYDFGSGQKRYEQETSAAERANNKLRNLSNQGSSTGYNNQY